MNTTTDNAISNYKSNNNPHTIDFTTFNYVDYMESKHTYITYKQIGKGVAIGYQAYCLLNDPDLDDLHFRRDLKNIMYNFVLEYSRDRLNVNTHFSLSENDIYDISCDVASALIKSSTFMKASFPDCEKFLNYINAVINGKLNDHLKHMYYRSYISENYEKLILMADTKEKRELLRHLHRDSHGPYLEVSVNTILHIESISSNDDDESDTSDGYNFISSKYAHSNPWNNTTIDTVHLKSFFLEYFSDLVADADNRGLKAKAVRVISLMTIINQSLSIPLYTHVDFINNMVSHNDTIQINEAKLLSAFSHFIAETKYFMPAIAFSSEDMSKLLHIDQSHVSNKVFSVSVKGFKEAISRDRSYIYSNAHLFTKTDDVPPLTR